MGFLGGGTRPPTIPEETPEAMSDDFDTGGGGGGAPSDGGDGGSSKKGFSKDRLAFLGGGGTNKGGLTASSNARNNCLGRGYACCFILTALAAGIVTGIYMTTGRNYGAWLSSAPPPNINSATDDNNREIPPPQTRRPTLSPTYFRTFSPTARPSTAFPTQVASQMPSSAPTNSSELETLSSDSSGSDDGGRGDGSDDGRGTATSSDDSNDGNDIFVTPEKLTLPAATRPKCKGRTNILHFVSFPSKLSTTTEVGALSTVIEEGAAALRLFKSSASNAVVCPDGSEPVSDAFCGRGPDRADCGEGQFCHIDPTDRFAVCCPDGTAAADDEPRVVASDEAILPPIDLARGMADNGMYLCLERKTCYSGELAVTDEDALGSLLGGMYLGWSIREVPPGTSNGDEIDSATARPVASGMLVGSPGDSYEDQSCTFQLPLPNPDAPTLPNCPSTCTSGAVFAYEPPPPPPKKCMAKETLHEIVILDAETNERVAAAEANGAAQSLEGMTLVVTAQAKRRVNTIAEVDLSSVVGAAAASDDEGGNNDRYVCLKDDRCYGAALTMDGGGNSEAAGLIWQLKKVEDASGTATANGGEKKKRRKKKNAAATTSLPTGVVAEGTLDLLNGALEACDFALPRPGGGKKKGGGNGNKRKNNKGNKNGGNGGGNKGNGTGNKKKRGNKKKNNNNNQGGSNNSTEGPERKDNVTDANNATNVGGGGNETMGSTTLRTCWQSDTDRGVGSSYDYSLFLYDADTPFVCISFCFPCAADMPEMYSWCTDEQRAEGAEVSVNDAASQSLLEDYVTIFNGNYDFRWCDTNDCNKANACTGSTDDWGGDNDDDDSALRCWRSDPYSGTGLSLPVDDDMDYVCISYCWDCATADKDDTFCTQEQRAEGARVSINMALAENSLAHYETTYADNEFQSCAADDCNKANACTGSTDWGDSAGGGDNATISSGSSSAPRRCWNSDPISGTGFSFPVPDDDDATYACASFCWDCGAAAADDTLCTELQRTEGWNVSVNIALPEDAVDFYGSTYANNGFQSCDTDNCNKANACTGSTDDWDGYDIYNSTLRCWTSDIVSGIGFSLPVPIEDDDVTYVCTSFCWTCGDTADDGCTQEQRNEGTNVSVNYAVALDSLEEYRSTYADYGFQHCDDANDCNMANACTGSTEDWASPGGRRLWQGRQGKVASLPRPDRVEDDQQEDDEDADGGELLQLRADRDDDDEDARRLQKGGGGGKKKNNGGGGGGGGKKRRGGGGKKGGNGGGGGPACATTCTRSTNVAAEGKRRRKKKDNVFEKDSRRWRRDRRTLLRGEG